MSIIIRNKFYYMCYFLEEYQIESLDKYAYIQNKIMVINGNVHHRGLIEVSIIMGLT